MPQVHQSRSDKAGSIWTSAYPSPTHCYSLWLFILHGARHINSSLELALRPGDHGRGQKGMLRMPFFPRSNLLDGTVLISPHWPYCKPKQPHWIDCVELVLLLVFHIRSGCHRNHYFSHSTGSTGSRASPRVRNVPGGALHSWREPACFKSRPYQALQKKKKGRRALAMIRKLWPQLQKAPRWYDYML